MCDDAVNTDDVHGLQETLLPSLSGAQLRPSSCQGEAYRLTSLGWPLVVEEVVTYGSTIIAILMVGKLGAFPLSVFSLARSITNMTGISVLVGVTGGMDTFCSQSNGAGRHRLLGITLQRGVAITLLACLPLMLLYTQAHTVLGALGQEPELAAAAGRYIRLYSPLIPIHGTVLCVYRYLIAQGAVAYVMAAGCVYLAATAPINWLLIFKLGLGLDGSALAAVACDAVYLVALLVMAAHHNMTKAPASRPWQGFSACALRQWGPYLRLAAASTLMVVLDWWIYDACTLLAGMLPHSGASLAAMGISYNINSLSFMVPFGLSFAVCARVGSCLGAGQSRAAKLSAEVGTCMGLAVMVLLGAGLIIGGSAVARPFSEDPEVLGLAAEIMPPLALALIANGGTAVLAGVLRGCGRQLFGAVANFVVNWGLGLAAVMFFAFKLKLGAAGLWWGLCLASYMQFLVLAVLVARFDWGDESRRSLRMLRCASQGAVQ